MEAVEAETMQDAIESSEIATSVVDEAIEKAKQMEQEAA